MQNLFAATSDFDGILRRTSHRLLRIFIIRFHVSIGKNNGESNDGRVYNNGCTSIFVNYIIGLSYMLQDAKCSLEECLTWEWIKPNIEGKKNVHPSIVAADRRCIAAICCLLIFKDTYVGINMSPVTSYFLYNMIVAGLSQALRFLESATGASHRSLSI